MERPLDRPLGEVSPSQPPGAGVAGGDVVVVTEVDGVVVLAPVVLVGDDDDVVVGLVAGAAGAPVVSVTVDVLVETDVEAAAVAGASTAHATRGPESPVAKVSASGPGIPSWVYRCGMFAKLSGSSWIINALPSGPFRSSAVKASLVATTFPEPSDRTFRGVRSPLAGCPV
jgi:hypothetical protein